MLIAGIDYSMTCPCVTVCEANANLIFANCRSYYLIDKKKYSGVFNKNIEGTLFETPSDQYKRFDMISDWAYNLVKNCTQIIIEDYSMGSKGRIFHIAENTAFLKYKLYKNDKNFITLPPTMLKKYASGKGNSDKDIMYACFEKETKCNLKKIFQTKGEKTASPITDIVDSYYLLKYLNNSLEKNSNV